MSFDPFRPDDVGDYSANLVARRASGRRRSVVVRAGVAVGAVALLAAAALVAVAVA
jgi:hypothetical protein